MVIAKEWRVKRTVAEGYPTLEDFEIVKVDLGDDLAEGEILVQTTFISVDPVVRLIMKSLKAGDKIPNDQVGVVKASKNKAFPVGALVVSHVGWVDHYKVDPSKETEPPEVVDPSIRDLVPHSMFVGHCGMPGATAHLAMKKLNPQKGDTMFINAAAGAVGSLVGQLAKMVGCKVIGSAGSEDKVRWIKEDLGFDYAFNYKKVSLSQALAEAAPEGVSHAVEHVCGPDLADLVKNMKVHGQILVVGAISTYNDSTPKVPAYFTDLIMKEVTISGLICYLWKSEWQEGIRKIAKLIHEGKVKAQETVYNGFGKVPQAFLELFEGKNTGKSVVKL